MSKFDELQIGKVDIYKSYNWENQKNSNPLHRRNQYDLNFGAINKTNHVEDQQRSQFGLGIGFSRKLTEPILRPSPNGLCPTPFRPGSDNQFEYNGAIHTFANTFDPNPVMNKLY